MNCDSHIFLRITYRGIMGATCIVAPFFILNGLVAKPIKRLFGSFFVHPKFIKGLALNEVKGVK